MKFIDSNILIYAVDEAQPDKYERACNIVEAAIRGNGFVISVQVLNEFASVLYRKFKKSDDEVRELLSIAGRIKTVPVMPEWTQLAIDIKAQGYETQTVTTNRKFSAGFFILDIFTGVLWLVVDFATGNLYKQKPKKIHYNLMPIGNTSMVQTESATVNTNVNVVKPVEKTAEPTKQTKVVAPAVTYKPGDEVYCSSFFSFGKCQPVSVKAVKTDGTCIVANSDGKELKKTPKYIYPKGGESSAFKLGNSVRFGNKIFGVKTGKVVSVPNAEKCIVETSKGDFVLKKQSALMKE